MEFYKGNCLGVMESLIDKGCQVDCIATDSPYGMGFQSNHRTEKHDSIHGDDNLDWLEDFVDLSFDIAKENTGHFFFCSHHNIDVFKQALERRFKVKSLLVWVKNNTSMGDLEGNFASKTEFIWFVHKGRAVIRGSRDPNVLFFDRTGNDLHPTQKPVQLMRYLISKFTDEGDLVLDPFMGSGTTGVACKKCKRRFIGIEIDQHHFETSVKRVRRCCGGQAQLRMSYDSEEK